jgi:hypothetical protein
MVIRIAGVVCKITGVVVILGATLLFRFVSVLRIMAPDFVAWFHHVETATIVAYGLTALLLCSGVFLFWLGRQFSTLAKTQTIGDPSESTLLYLRLFKVDSSFWGQIMRQLILLPLRGLGIWFLTTPEEQLAETLHPLGNLVAIGRPGEVLPKPGAARVYASDADWRKAVTNHMQAARIVILRAGISTSLFWELEQAVMNVPPERLLILLLRLPTRDYRNFHSAANPIFAIVGGVSLPELVSKHPFRISEFITFSKEWKPSFRPLEAPFLRKGRYKSYRPLFKYALKPVFEQLHVKWRAPRISVLAVLSIVLLIAIAFGILRQIGLIKWLP